MTADASDDEGVAGVRFLLDGAKTTDIPHIIWDNDEGGDADGAAAGAILMRLADLGECTVLALNSYHTETYSAQCMEALLRWAGRFTVPVGIDKDTVASEDLYGSELAALYAGWLATTPPYPNAVSVARQLLQLRTMALSLMSLPAHFEISITSITPRQMNTVP